MSVEMYLALMAPFAMAFGTTVGYRHPNLFITWKKTR